MLDKLKNLFKKKTQPEVKPQPKAKKKAPELTAKERATAAGEPYINILSLEVDPENINAGAFELDWNDKFILNLIRAGYKIREDDTDRDLVDRWFQTVCRNVVSEVYEQQQADPEVRQRGNSFVRQYDRKDLGGGRSEIS